MYTGRKNEKAAARAEEERSNVDLDSRRSGEIGGQSKSSWTKQERIDRTDSQGSSVFAAGTTITGGMLDHLIEEYGDQVALQQQQIQRLNEDITHRYNEIKRLESRIQEFKMLRDEFQKQFEEKV